MRKEIGGMRLGSGNKLSVDMPKFPRSTHDLGYIWRSSMAPGTLVPFMSKVALPGDTFDITLNTSIMTHPTLGPLFGSFKIQLDVFEAPVRLYVPALMQNTLNIGNNMSNIFIPKIQSTTIPATTITAANSANPDNLQINGSALLSYLGQRGWGNNKVAGVNNRKMNGIPMLMYWEIYKNYYANKQETNAFYLLPQPNTTQNITGITVGGTALPQYPTSTPINQTNVTSIVISYGAGAAPTLSQIVFTVTDRYGKTSQRTAADFASWTGGAAGPSTWVSGLLSQGGGTVNNWNYQGPGITPILTGFPLSNIDAMKNNILALNPLVEFVINQTANAPYGPGMDIANTPGSQCGLGVKTYQSDLFNNWINTTTFTNITTSTSVSTGAGSFTIDSFILARKVYALLNKVAISGGSYNDWINAAYGVDPMATCISPVYHGGLSKELTFQEITSSTQNAQGNQPLGTLAGKGHQTQKHKGGKITIHTKEHGYIMGIISITPRLDYSQGNSWDTYALTTMNDFHKPDLDQIGFQDLIQEQMAWWDTSSTVAGTWVQTAAGKQPAWLNYMTEINKCYGNFADQFNEMFMTLNRRYVCAPTGGILLQTTYIDPSYYNFIFAQTSADSMNFWVQIAVDITARRLMSAKIMPNL